MSTTGITQERKRFMDFYSIYRSPEDSPAVALTKAVSGAVKTSATRQARYGTKGLSPQAQKKLKKRGQQNN